MPESEAEADAGPDRIGPHVDARHHYAGHGAEVRP